MHFPRVPLLFVVVATAITMPWTVAQDASSPSAAKHGKKFAGSETGLENGAVSGRVYHNKSLALSCTIPDGWVLRTDEMNGRGLEQGIRADSSVGLAMNGAGRVLLAAFSRPPEARGQEVNSSLLIAAESTSAYPGLHEPTQYFGPLAEVAKAQGFIMDQDLYEVAVGGRTLVRGDFRKDVGSRVVHQSTLAMLAHGYAVSITILAGSENEIEEVLDGINFLGTAK